MTYAWDNDSTQNAHIKQMRDDRQKAYMETHRDNKAYERFKHMPDYGKGAVMERLTSNKKVSDMSMIELAHNSCYADNERNARYRDYDLDIDSRQLVRNLMKDMHGEDLSDLTDEELFYRNLWAMANLRETLKKYEDLEEQGKLVKLPCKDVYFIIDINNPKYAMVMKKPIRELAIYEIEDIDKENCKYFSTKEKAKARLKELRGGEDE